jgi:hypothetical protein
MIRYAYLVVGVGFFVACGGSSSRTGSRGGEGDGDQGGSWGNEPVPEGGTGATGAGGAAGSVPAGGTSAGGGPTTGGVGADAGTGGSASSNGGALEPPGPVFCGGVECEAPRACCNANSRCFDPETEPEVCPRPDPDPAIPDLRACTSNAHCESGEYCHQSAFRFCEGSGFCQSRSECPHGGDRVCACDGNSYADVGTACRSGTNVPQFRGGECGDTIDLNGGEDGPPRLATLCGVDEHCPVGMRCCALTRICYPVSDPDRCSEPPEGTYYPCTADDQCHPVYEFCSGEGCEGPGGCLNLQNEECGVRLEPVCGCNGVSYTSAACATAEGVRVRAEGECGASE